MARQKWRSSKEYRHWRKDVIRRDRVCQVCSSRKNRHAHHINDASYHPLLRYDIGNGICLCRTCHTSLHIDYKRGYRKKTTDEDLKRFLRITKLQTRNINGKNV